MPSRYCSRTSRSLAIPLLVQPFTRTDFSSQASGFQHRLSGTRCYSMRSDSLTVFYSRFKTFCSVRLLLKTDQTCCYGL